MVIRKLLGAFARAIGPGGLAIELVLDDVVVLPGSSLTGRMKLYGGTAEARVRKIDLSFLAGGDELITPVSFARQKIRADFSVPQEVERSEPFSVQVPWQTPINEAHGEPLGLPIGVVLAMAVVNAPERTSEVAPLTVRASPVQEAILGAFKQLGFSAREIFLAVEGPEIEFVPPKGYAPDFSKVVVIPSVSPEGCEVIIKADRRRRGTFTVSHEDATGLDWNAEVTSWLQRLTIPR